MHNPHRTCVPVEELLLLLLFSNLLFITLVFIFCSREGGHKFKALVALLNVNKFIYC